MVEENQAGQSAKLAAGSGATRARAARQGSVLVEFSVVALAFYLLLAGTLEMGRMITTSQILENAARAGARELALIQLPATSSFHDALADARVRARVYDPTLLAIPVPTGELHLITDGWPIINRMLVPLMIVDEIGGVSYLHFPGPVVQAGGALTVVVPHVVSRDAAGHEQIQWIPVLEEVVPDADTTHAPFSLASTGPQRGVVALRLNCPYQASALTDYHPSAPSDPPSENPILAADGSVTQTNAIGDVDPGGAVLVGDSDTGAYAGSFGLGKFYALNKEVRPFRRLISAQSIFRREVFSQ